jgi:hypothetical protein
MSPIQYLEHLASGAPILKKALTKTLEYWEPDEPPITIMFGAIGRAIGENLANFSEEIKRGLRSTIERGMEDQDQRIQDAVATGLIEALMVTLESEQGSWRSAREILGPESMKHAEGWWNFDFGKHKQ